MLTKEQREHYGIPEEAYQKTTQFQIDQFEKSLHEFWEATGLKKYLEKISEWISRKNL